MSGTVYKKVDPTLRSLIDDIKMGEIALPDLQRPFVWKNAKIRNLFDSMYRGFPVGYFLFWEPAVVTKTRTIGADTKQRTPRLLVVDGQQRLTSLYAVLTGTQVVRANYTKENIEIAFNPLTEKFEVADAAIRRDKAYLSNITNVWAPGADIFEIADNYIAALSGVRSISPEETKKAKNSLNKLSSLINYPFTALELTSSVSEEEVSEVFVRINSEGKKLNQADFILTLMSVFWDQGRAQLEKFCREARQFNPAQASPFNHFIQPEADQLLRVGVGLAFRRARLHYVYSLLRGKDLETEQFSDERRVQQFDKLKDAQARVINLQYWHDFLKAVYMAGFRSSKMISSDNNLLFSYILYLLGKTEFKIEEAKLRSLIARWFFMSSLTGRFSSSPESKMEFDLASLREVKSAQQFEAILNNAASAKMTEDYWEISLPNELATSASISPSKFAYLAALNILDAQALYSVQKVSALLDPSVKAPRTAVEMHHLFPKDYLDSIGIKENRDKNQIANYALIEWSDNSDISCQSPQEYSKQLETRFDKKQLERMYYWHALPDGWQTMDYSAFLQARREKIAGIIRDAYFQLLKGGSGSTLSTDIDLQKIISEGETASSEFKSTLRMNLHTKEKDSRMELAVLKTIAGFVNSKAGGTLVIGIADDGTPIGIEADEFADEDKMNLHLMNLIRDRMGANHALYIHPRFDDHENVRVLVVECLPSRSPVFVKDGKEERFYVRNGASTADLSGAQAQEYISQRF